MKLAGRNTDQYFLNAFYAEKWTQMCKSATFWTVISLLGATGVSRCSGMSITFEVSAVVRKLVGCGAWIMATTQVGIFRKNRKISKKWAFLGYSVLDFREGAWYLVHSNLIVAAEVYTTLRPKAHFSARTHMLYPLGTTKFSQPVFIYRRVYIHIVHEASWKSSLRSNFAPKVFSPWL